LKCLILGMNKMANEFDGGFKVEGLRELQDALKQLPDNIAKNVLRGAVASGAAVIRDQAKSNAPVYHGDVSKGHPPPGTLKRSIYIKQIREFSDLHRQVFFIGVRRGKQFRNQGKKGNLSQDAFYWTWVEFGHYWHSGKSITTKSERGKLYRGESFHEGAQFVLAHPFLRPAFESQKDNAVEQMKAYMTKRIPDEVAKLKGASK